MSNLQLLCATCNLRKGPSLTVNHLPSQLVGRKDHVPNPEKTVKEGDRAERGCLPGPFYSHSPGSQVLPKQAMRGIRSMESAVLKGEEMNAEFQRSHSNFVDRRTYVEGRGRQVGRFLDSFEGVNVAIVGGYPEVLQMQFEITVEAERMRKELRKLVLAWSEVFHETIRLWKKLAEDSLPVTDRLEALVDRMDEIPRIRDSGTQVSRLVAMLNEQLDLLALANNLVADRDLAKSIQQLEDLDEKIRRYCTKKLKPSQDRGAGLPSEVTIPLDANTAGDEEPEKYLPDSIQASPTLPEEASRPGRKRGLGGTSLRPK